MTDQAHGIPPEIEINAEADMAAEEFLGRPLSGNPVNRIRVLTNRIAYLQRAIQAFDLPSVPQSDWSQQTIDARNSYQRDLAEAPAPAQRIPSPARRKE